MSDLEGVIGPGRESRTVAWMKLNDSLLADLRARGFTAEESLAWIGALCIASRETRAYRGMLLCNRRPAQNREIAIEAGVSPDIVQSAIRKAVEWDMLVTVGHPTTGEEVLEVANWDLMQLDRTSRERKQKQRAGEATAEAMSQ